MFDERNERFYQMTNAPIPELLIRMSVPTIIAMLVSSVYNITDTFFVGMLGKTVYTAAIGVVFNLMSFVQAIGFMFGHGSGNYMSRCLGKKDHESASVMAVTGFGIAMVTGIAVMLIGFIFKRPLVTLLGGSKTPELEKACLEYITVIMFTIPAMIGTFTLNNQLRLQGSAADGMKGMGIGMILNIILDPVFIFVFKMGLVGAGVATLIGQYAGFAGLFIMTGANGNIRIEPRKFMMSSELMKEIFGGGAPNFIRQGITTVSSILLIHAAGVYGEATISAFTITTRVCAVGFSVVIGFGQGFQPICGYNYGAQLYSRMKEAFYYCLRVVTTFLIAVTALLYFFSPFIMQIFVKQDPYTVELGVKILRCQCISLVFMGWYTLVGMLLQNIGEFMNASVISSLRQGICFIPLVLIMPVIFKLDGLIMVQPVADMISFIISVPFGVRTFSQYEARNYYY